MVERKKVAAIVTTYFPHSHADLIVSKFAAGFPTRDGLVEPAVDLVSMYMDQLHPADVGMELAREHGVEVNPSIRGALTLTPPSATGHWPTASDWKVGDLAVDGVLIIAEHGDYCGNERGRQMYPRRYFFEQVCGVLAASGRSRADLQRQAPCLQLGRLRVDVREGERARRPLHGGVFNSGHRTYTGAGA